MRSVRLRAVVLAALAFGGCRAFVDLDGLQGGAAPEDAAPDVTADTDLSDAGSDRVVVDVIPPLDVIEQDSDAANPCPTKGGAALRVPTPNGGSFCIDATEVTRGEYATFLASNPDGGGQSARCTWNTSFAPATPSPPPAADVNKPAHVDWCDADTFCKWAGKRLCGKVGGGVLTYPAAGTTESEQVFVCSAGGTRVYPYGNVFDAKKCNGGDVVAGTVEDVKSRPECVGGFAGVFNANGNTHQWLDACVISADPALDQCAVTRGAYDGHPMEDMPCSAVEGTTRSNLAAPYGFRCCAD